MSLLSKKVSGNSVVWFDRSCDDKNRTDGLRNRRKDGQKHYTLRNFITRGIISLRGFSEEDLLDKVTEEENRCQIVKVS